MSGPYLRLSAHLLTERYHGTEWPPSPARAFQALVAGMMTGQWRDTLAPSARDALRWLERLPAPWIYARRPRELPAYRISVPNNDVDRAAREWAKGKPYDAAKLRTLKDVSGRELGGPGPHIHYLWPLNDTRLGEARTHETTLRKVSHCLHTLGWGIDMAFADVAIADGLSDLEGELWKPGESGRELAIPIGGFLEDLESAYRRFQTRLGPAGINADTRPKVYGAERYLREGKKVRGYCAFALRELQGENADGRRNFFRYPAGRTAVAAAWLRHASIEAVKRRTNAESPIQKHPDADNWMAWVSGHPASGEEGERLSYVPLPSIGAAKTDGWIRRVMIVESLGGSGDLTEFLGQALLGIYAVDEERGEVCEWAEIAPGDSVIRSYLGPSRAWESVTPMILHGHNSQRGRISLHKTSKLILEAFRNAGYPAGSVEDFYMQAAPLVPQLPAAAQFFVPTHLRHWPRYHVGVRFKEPITGPVLAGIGRHCGLGLFRPADERPSTKSL